MMELKESVNKTIEMGFSEVLSQLHIIIEILNK